MVFLKTAGFKEKKIWFDSKVWQQAWNGLSLAKIE